MNIENSKKDNMELDSAGTSLKTSDIKTATNATLKLLNNLESLLNITKASDNGAEIYEKSEQVVKDLTPIVDQAQKGILNEINITTLVKEVNSLAMLIQRTKAMNPLISDELVVKASDSAQEADLALTLTKKALDHKNEIEKEDQEVADDSDPKVPTPERAKESKKGCMAQILIVFALILVSLYY